MILYFLCVFLAKIDFAATQISVGPIGDSWAQLNWQTHPNSSRYMITYGQNGPFDHKLFVPSSNDEQHSTKLRARLTDLKPGTLYHVQIQPIDQSENIYIGHQEQFRTLHHPFKPDAPVNLRVSARSSNYLVVQWYRISSPLAEHTILEYRLKTPDDSMAFIEKRVGSQNNQTILSDLEPDSHYEIRAKTVIGSGMTSDWSLVLEASTTQPTRSQYAPNRLKIVPDSMDPTVAWIQWNHGISPNKLILQSIQYVVLYTPVEIDDDEEDDYSFGERSKSVALWYKHLVYPAGHNRTALRNLKPRTLYRIKLMARNIYFGRDSQQAVSETVLYRTPDNHLFRPKFYWSAVWIATLSIALLSLLSSFVIWEKRRRAAGKSQKPNPGDHCRRRSESFRSSFLLLMQSPEPTSSDLLTQHNMSDLRSGSSFMRKSMRNRQDGSCSTDFEQQQRQHLCTFSAGSSSFQHASQRPADHRCYQQQQASSCSTTSEHPSSQPPVPPMRQRFA